MNNINIINDYLLLNSSVSGKMLSFSTAQVVYLIYDEARRTDYLEGLNISIPGFVWQRLPDLSDLFFRVSRRLLLLGINKTPNDLEDLLNQFLQCLVQFVKYENNSYWVNIDFFNQNRSYMKKSTIRFYLNKRMFIFVNLIKEYVLEHPSEFGGSQLIENSGFTYLKFQKRELFEFLIRNHGLEVNSNEILNQLFRKIRIEMPYAMIRRNNTYYFNIDADYIANGNRNQKIKYDLNLF